MPFLKVENLCKKYPSFQLKDVSFELEPGYIMGFIGSNGAGKTTTLKSIMGLVIKDSGKISIFDKDFTENEIELKQEIGLIFGSVDYYKKSTIKNISNVVSRFYERWDDKLYRSYLKRFGLDENKKVDELSHGMRVKYSLTLALSYDARLLILDEPTSGLDPVARDDLLELFQELIEDGKRSILFSTHITSDLEKCADHVTFIQNGQIIKSCERDALLDSYRIIKGTKEQLLSLGSEMISYKTNMFGFSGLIRTDQVDRNKDIVIETPSLEDIMIYFHKQGVKDEESNI